MEKKSGGAMKAALRYLSRRRYTAFQVEKHLAAKDFETAEIKEVMKKLSELGYIDDEEYALLYIEYAVNKGRGLNRIRMELKEKGVGDNIIDDAIYQYNCSVSESGEELKNERERALEQALKFTEGKALDEKLIGRIARRLSSLGYEAPAVYHVIEYLKKINKGEEN